MKLSEALRSISGLGRSPGEGNGNPFQYSCLESPIYRGAWRAMGEGSGTPLPCSCLENPRGGGAWWAADSGVAQSWTRLKRLSSSSSSPAILGAQVCSQGVSVSPELWQRACSKHLCWAGRWPSSPCGSSYRFPSVLVCHASKAPPFIRTLIILD